MYQYYVYFVNNPQTLGRFKRPKYLLYHKDSMSIIVAFKELCHYSTEGGTFGRKVAALFGPGQEILETQTNIGNQS